MLSFNALVAFLFAFLFAGNVESLASTDTITWGGDNSRAGYQTLVFFWMETVVFNSRVY